MLFPQDFQRILVQALDQLPMKQKLAETQSQKRGKKAENQLTFTIVFCAVSGIIPIVLAGLFLQTAMRPACCLNDSIDLYKT